MSIIPNIDVHCSAGSPLHRHFLPLCVPILVCLAVIYPSIKNGYFRLPIHRDIPFLEQLFPVSMSEIFENFRSHNRFVPSYGFEMIFESYATIDRRRLSVKLVKTLHIISCYAL